MVECETKGSINTLFLNASAFPNKPKERIEYTRFPLIPGKDTRADAILAIKLKRKYESLVLFYNSLS